MRGRTHLRSCIDAPPKKVASIHLVWEDGTSDNNIPAGKVYTDTNLQPTPHQFNPGARPPPSREA